MSVICSSSHIDILVIQLNAVYAVVIKFLFVCFVCFFFFFFFFQAEDGIRDYKVTGVQTCALPIYGAVEMGHGVAYYWAGKVPAAQFFGAVPFGMNANQSNSWVISGDGGKLWEEIYRDRKSVV